MSCSRFAAASGRRRERVAAHLGANSARIDSHMSEVFTPALAIEAAPRRWISSPAFDLAFFIAPALLTFPIVIGTFLSIPFLAMWGVVLAFPHYISSIAFYLWNENRE